MCINNVLPDGEVSEMPNPYPLIEIIVCSMELSMKKVLNGPVAPVSRKIVVRS